MLKIPSECSAMLWSSTVSSMSRYLFEVKDVLVPDKLEAMPMVASDLISISALLVYSLDTAVCNDVIKRVSPNSLESKPKFSSANVCSESD